MTSFHNRPPQFRSFKKPRSLRLGLEPVIRASVNEMANFELDPPGIEFGDDAASVIDRVFNAETSDMEES